MLRGTTLIYPRFYDKTEDLTAAESFNRLSL